MKISKVLKRIAASVAVLMIAGMQPGFSSQIADQRKHVQVLILPKFEIGAMAGDFPGEAQDFYEEYLVGGDTYAMNGCPGEIGRRRTVPRRTGKGRRGPEYRGRPFGREV